MILIDRTSDIPIHVQLVSRLRFLIANGHFRSGEILPSTRKMGDQLGVSFHTVRKAYTALEHDKLVESRPGSGFRVLDYRPPSKSERMEQGAAIVHDTLERLLGLGLDEQEIEYLIQEQSSLLETEEYQHKIVVAGSYKEWGDRCAEQLMAFLQKEVIPSTLAELVHHADSDIVLVPFENIRGVLGLAPGGDVIGLQTELCGEALELVSRLLERETLGLVARYPDAIGALTSELRHRTRFSGQVLAISVQDGDSHVAPLIRQCELVLYTTGARRKVEPFLTYARKHAEIKIDVTRASLDRLRKLIPA